MNKEGNIFVVSAPSGAGKSTLVGKVMESLSNLRFSVSHTTRAMRPQEVNGKDYHFVSKEDFKKMEADNAFVESADVFGNFYGTSYKSIEDVVNSGDDIMLDIDIQGAEQLRNQDIPTTSIFILPPSLETLLDRLKSRGTNTPEDIATRTGKAREEISQYKYYDYVIVNDDLEEAAQRLEAIILATRSNLKNMSPQIEALDL